MINVTRYTAQRDRLVSLSADFSGVSSINGRDKGSRGAKTSTKWQLQGYGSTDVTDATFARTASPLLKGTLPHTNRGSNVL